MRSADLVFSLVNMVMFCTLWLKVFWFEVIQFIQKHSLPFIRKPPSKGEHVFCTNILDYQQLHYLQPGVASVSRKCAEMEDTGSKANQLNKLKITLKPFDLPSDRHYVKVQKNVLKFQTSFRTESGAWLQRSVLTVMPIWVL